jgi:hypothetical protein
MALRARRHEPSTLELDATYARRELTPTRLHRQPLPTFTISPLTAHPPQPATAPHWSTETETGTIETVPSRRWPRCGTSAGRQKRDQQHHRLRCLPAACAAARPPVAGDRRPAPSQTAPRAVAFAFGELESDETVANQSRCTIVTQGLHVSWAGGRLVGLLGLV